MSRRGRTHDGKASVDLETTVALMGAVCETAQRLEADGLVIGTAGNVSALDRDSNLVAITPSGFPYQALTPADIVLVDLEGRVLAGRRQPSSEIALHTSIYRQRKDVSGVVHTHSRYATAFSVLREPIPLICNEGMAAGCLRVDVAEFAIPGTRELADVALAALGRQPRSRAVLLANHGLVAIGQDLAAAFAVAAKIEFEANVYYLARSIGSPVVLTGEQMDQIRARYATPRVC